MYVVLARDAFFHFDTCRARKPVEQSSKPRKNSLACPPSFVTFSLDHDVARPVRVMSRKLLACCRMPQQLVLDDIEFGSHVRSVLSRWHRAQKALEELVAVEDGNRADGCSGSVHRRALLQCDSTLVPRTEGERAERQRRKVEHHQGLVPLFQASSFCVAVAGMRESR